MKQYYVYLVECKDGSFYIGITNNLQRRIYEHNIGLKENSYTYKRRPVELKWYETFTDPDKAIMVEKQLKGWSRRKKIALINENWDKLIEYSKNYTESRNILGKSNKSSTGSD
ncbi:GIY-YIG nuclease family protein [Aquimarina sp. 2201CG5-10]|uniref:GIY-YIG nuclease family protein n=1 Tax=Aquimarina callyspongiae TaxID=3098150 RepID=UPI002AB4920B|nr:GIY-YIG nuclease family protein [Aquimarina sp. 2201CG5-10]MDY8136769.1 GIY-YIG nuclease family protein [Aquimarina sp. 2201CG5-10]